jgi:hypothetical protein
MALFWITKGKRFPGRAICSRLLHSQPACNGAAPYRGGMNEWLDNIFAYWLEKAPPWLQSAELSSAFDLTTAGVPAVVWMGAALWLAVRLADHVQRLGALRSTAYWGSGALLATLSWLASSAGLMPSGTLPSSMLQTIASRSEWLLDMALGWILFTVGQQMDVRWLLRNKALAATAVLEFGVTALCITAVLIMLGLAWPAASVAGVLAAHSSPVVLASFAPDWQPDGQISARSVHLGGINTLLAALALPLTLALVQAWQQSTVTGAVQSVMGSVESTLPFLQRSGWELAQPVLLLLLSLVVGVVLGRLLARSATPPPTPSHKRAQARGGSMDVVAAACVCAGLAQWWGAPAWAACLALGLALRSPSGAAWRAGQGVQQAMTSLAQLALFALSAIMLIALLALGSAQFLNAQVAYGMVLALVAIICLIRLGCKLMVCTLTARWAGLRWQQGFLLGLAMQPLSLTGLALLLLAWPMLMQGDALVASSLALALVVSDCLAPMGLRALLQRCGEIAPDEIAGMQTRSSTRAERVDTSRESVLPSLNPALHSGTLPTAG